jgi:hypothetical protein
LTIKKNHKRQEIKRKNQSARIKQKRIPEDSNGNSERLWRARTILIAEFTKPDSQNHFLIWISDSLFINANK